MNKKIYDIVKNVLSEGSGKMCSECGSPSMNEGMCSECGYNEGEFSEELKGNQKSIDLNKNNKIDADDFRRLRMRKKHKKETNEEECYECGDKTMYELEVDESPEFNYAAIKAKELGKKRFKLGGKTFPVEEDVYELNMNESTGEKINLRESEIIEIIETIVTEEKKNKKTTKVNNATKSAQSISKKENDDYVNSVVKKMKDYLKGGSKGEFEMNPKHFPKGNGELGEMGKKAYIPSSAVEEYIENFTAAALENIEYDDIKPNENWVEDNLIGSSRTGNNPKWANAVETEVGERRNKIRKDNLLGKLKKKAYNKAPQPVNDEAGENADKASKLLMKLESTESKKVINEINQMKSLINYNKKSQ